MKLSNIMALFACAWHLGMSTDLFAYKVIVQNATPFDVRIKTKYVGESAIACRSDDFELSSGHEQTINSGGCLLKEITATAFKKKSSGYIGAFGVTTGEDDQEAAKYSSSGRGDGTFIVYGPVNGQFGVTRLCNEAGSLSH